jgi:hypothetical protein
MNGVHAKKFFLKLIFLTFLTFCTFSQDDISSYLRGAQLTNYVEHTLKKNKFNPLKTELVHTGNDIFASNLTLDFTGSTYSYSTDIDDQKKSLIVIDIKQEDFFRKTDAIIDLIKFVRDSKFEFSVEFVFTAMDEASRVPFRKNFQQNGTSVFASSMIDTDNTVALILSFDNSYNESRIYTAGFKNSSPMWLTKRIVESFNEEKIAYVSPQKFLSIYRAGLLSGNQNMTSFFINSMPCISIVLSDDTHTAAVKNFLTHYSVDGTDKEDIHYTFFQPKFLKPLWISERINIIALEIFGVLSILILCSFSFIGKSRIKYKKAFSKFWYIIPLTILVSLISLYAGQLFCRYIPVVHRANPIIQFVLKIIVSTIFVTIFFTFQSHFSKEGSEFIYGYNLTLIAVANVFIFCAADITLFWMFVFEYLVIYFSRNLIKIHGLVISIVLMITPFLPYLAVIAANSSTMDLYFIIYSSFFRNFMLAMALFPFQIMWLRVLARIRYYQQHKTRQTISLKKMLSFGFISAGIIAALVIIFGVLMTTFFYNKTHTTNISQKIIDTTPSRLSVTQEQGPEGDKSSRIIKIKSNHEADRYIVTVLSPTSVPVLDSTYEYKVRDNTTQVEFIIPDYPPQEISIGYSTDPKLSHQINVTALYYESKLNQYSRESIQLEYAGQGESR